MKGLIAKSFTAACLGGALAAAGGCYTYHDLVDPCYPQRYNMASAQEVRSAFEPQEANGHVLDQTVWNYCFDPGTDRLNGLGMEHLNGSSADGNTCRDRQHDGALRLHCFLPPSELTAAGRPT